MHRVVGTAGYFDLCRTGRKICGEGMSVTVFLVSPVPKGVYNQPVGPLPFCWVPLWLFK